LIRSLVFASLLCLLGLASCGGSGEENAVRDAIEAGLHQPDINSVKVSGDTATAYEESNGKEIAIELAKHGTKWYIEHCTDSNGVAEQCPLNGQ
jgi:hypothetical protein